MTRTLPAGVAVEMFVSLVRQRCREHEVAFELRAGRRCDSGDGIRCRGFFESDTRRLVVAAGGPWQQWLPVLAHEYGHMTQWLADAKRWWDAEDELFIAWLGGRRLSDERRWRAFRAARDVELDCERRTLRIAARNHLPIDPAAYARSANAYVAFYRVAHDYRRWYVRGPFESSRVLALCPATIMPAAWHDQPPAALVEAIVAECLPAGARPYARR